MADIINQYDSHYKNMQHTKLNKADRVYTSPRRHKKEIDEFTKGESGEEDNLTGVEKKLKQEDNCKSKTRRKRTSTDGSTKKSNYHNFPIIIIKPFLLINFGDN